MPRPDHAHAARRLAEALDGRFQGRLTWELDVGELDTSVALVEPACTRFVARVRLAGTALEVRTPGSCAGDRLWWFDAQPVGQVVEAIVENLTRVTLWDLVPGRCFAVRVALRGLAVGTVLRLADLDELKPSGRDIYRFEHGGGDLVLRGDLETDIEVLDNIGHYMSCIGST